MRHLLSTIIALIIMTGCSKDNKTYQYVIIPSTTIEEMDRQKYSTLLERFSDYWEASSLNDFESAYAYELPYLNYLKSLDWYLDFKRNAKRHYTITLLRITPDQDDADIAYVRYNIRGKNIDANLTEKWININETWYHRYAQSILPPKPPKVR